MNEMDEFLTSGMEDLGGFLRTNSTTKASFKLLAGVFEEISELISEQNKGMAGSFCELFVEIFDHRRVLTAPSQRTLVEL